MAQATDGHITPARPRGAPSTPHQRRNTADEAARLRAKMEGAVERLLKALDAATEDLEDGGDDEEGHDLEDDPAEMGIGDRGGLNTDDEPSLGALNNETVVEQRRTLDECA